MIQIELEDQLWAILYQPTEFIILTVVSLILTELIKWPIKRKAGNATWAGWVYILISLVCVFAVATGYACFIAEPNTTHYTMEYVISMFAAQQTLFNIIWDKGIKKVVSAIVARVTGKKAAEVEGAIDKSGVDKVLDKVDEYIKTQPKSNLTGKSINTNSTDDVKRHNGRPRV